ncbi:MAG: glutamine amidotransferase [Corynebacterium sp.]|nr:glutamine amidotransferase [Corynebacterium sp.]
MSEFLFVSLRPAGSPVAAAEYQDFVRATGVWPVHRVLGSVADELGDISQFAGVIVGGSSLNVLDVPYGEYQEHIHGQLRLLIDASVPVFFICFGASWLADHTGGVVDNEHAETSGASVVQLTEVGLGDPVCAGLPAEFVSFTGHTEAIAAVGADVSVLATGPTCPVQLIRLGDRVWASQFHCEMDAAALEARMRFFMDYGYFPRSEFAEIVAGLGLHDVRFAHQLLKNFVMYCTDKKVSDVTVFAS